MKPPLSIFNSRLAQREAAFTMIEIAISLAIIAFALIAIIGILPTGLQVNRDNREETLINQDARLLVEAIKSGGRDITSDIGSYVTGTDSVLVAGIPTTNLIQLLSDTNRPHDIVLSSISGAVANRGTDFGFRYQVRNHVTNAADFAGTILSNQTYEVRLRFAWPVRPDNTVNTNYANTYVVRALITGWRTNDVFYAQQYYRPAP